MKNIIGALSILSTLVHSEEIIGWETDRDSLTPACLATLSSSDVNPTVENGVAKCGYDLYNIGIEFLVEEDKTLIAEQSPVVFWNSDVCMSSVYAYPPPHNDTYYLDFAFGQTYNDEYFQFLKQANDDCKTNHTHAKFGIGTYKNHKYSWPCCMMQRNLPDSGGFESNLGTWDQCTIYDLQSNYDNFLYTPYPDPCEAIGSAEGYGDYQVQKYTSIQQGFVKSFSLDKMISMKAGMGLSSFSDASLASVWDVFSDFEKFKTAFRMQGEALYEACVASSITSMIDYRTVVLPKLAQIPDASEYMEFFKVCQKMSTSEFGPLIKKVEGIAARRATNDLGSTECVLKGAFIDTVTTRMSAIDLHDPNSYGLSPCFFDYDNMPKSYDEALASEFQWQRTYLYKPKIVSTTSSVSWGASGITGGEFPNYPTTFDYQEKAYTYCNNGVKRMVGASGTVWPPSDYYSGFGTLAQLKNISKQWGACTAS